MQARRYGKLAAMNNALGLYLKTAKKGSIIRIANIHGIFDLKFIREVKKEKPVIEIKSLA